MGGEREKERERDEVNERARLRDRKRDQIIKSGQNDWAGWREDITNRLPGDRTQNSMFSIFLFHPVSGGWIPILLIPLYLAVLLSAFKQGSPCPTYMSRCGCKREGWREIERDGEADREEEEE